MSTLGLCGTCRGGSGPPWGRFGRQLAVCSLCFSINLKEKCDLCISTPLSNGSQVLKVPAPKLEPLGQKSRANRIQKPYPSSQKAMKKGKQIGHRSTITTEAIFYSKRVGKRDVILTDGHLRQPSVIFLEVIIRIEGIYILVYILVYNISISIYHQTQ